MSQPATTLESLRKIIIRDFEIDPQLLQTDARLEDFAIDSLGVIEILFAVEEEFGIIVPPEPPDTRTSINTVGDLVGYIDHLLSEQHGGNQVNKALP
jgi:acyl carrier protein